MRISCITTVYNDGPVLMNAVRSVLSQSHRDLQLIIVDDGSDEETAALVQGIDDDRVLVIRQANDGLAGARNKGLEQADGDYVCFLDADDTRPAWALAEAVDLAKRTDADVVFWPGVLSELDQSLRPFYDSERIDQLAAMQAADRSREPEFAAIAQMLEPQAANKLVRRSMIIEEHIGFPNTHFFEDMLFHTEIVAAARRVAVCAHPGFTYFRHYGRPQITSTAGEMRFDSIAVAKITLERFALRRRFSDPLCRAAALAHCMKLVAWCEATTGYAHKTAFRITARAMLAGLPKAYLDFPAKLPLALGDIEGHLAYARGLADA